jgi:transcriptional regulator with XRE-family HTH domain
VKIIGSKLKDARESAGITRAELAETADMSHVRIWQLEQDGTHDINRNVLKAIVKKLKVTVDDLRD